MKKFTPNIIAGLIGGLLVLFGGFTFNYFSNNSVKESLSFQSPNEHTKLVVNETESPLGPAAPNKYLNNANLDFTGAAENAMPAVVLIKSQASRSLPQRRQEQNNPFSRFFDLDDFFDGGSYFQPKQGSGSGVIISTDGYIVTNNHVVDFADQFLVTLNDGTEYNGTLIGKDSETDLAVLKIEGRNFPAVEIGSSETSKVGEWVLAIGNPFELTNTVTAGIISAKGRDIGLRAGGEGINAFIQTDAAVNSGNSGGALVNLEGELIGINTAIFTRNGGYVGYSFAIPAEIVNQVARNIIDNGTPGYLGITIADMDAAIKSELGLSVSEGVYVYSLQRGGPAMYAGLLSNDVIVKVNGQKVKNSEQLQNIIGGAKAGESVTLTIDRYGEKKEIPVQLKAG